ncbi:MAG TPA: helix-turn-helix domain-containing protein [Longilinea sp.]|nr:helix-turn-helix domain-containing protein [Longilinea sp.]
MKNDSIENFFIVQDIATLRVLADPLRSKIHEMLTVQPLTVRQVADRLGESAGKLYYHFNLLEKHNLIKVISTRKVVNMMEKTYVATSRCIDVDSSLLNTATDEGRESILTLAASTLDTTREDMLRSLHARIQAVENGAPENPREIILNRLSVRLREDTYQEFVDRLHKLLADFEAAGIEDNDSISFTLAAVLYPNFYFPETPTPEE